MANTHQDLHIITIKNNKFFEESFSKIPDSPNPLDLTVRLCYEESGLGRCSITPSKADLSTADAFYSSTQVVGVKIPSGGNVAYGDGVYHLYNDARSIFLRQPTRLFVRGFLINEGEFEHWLFTRNGLIRSKPVAYDRNTHNLIMGCYERMTDAQLGMNPFVQEHDAQTLKLDLGHGKVFLMGKEPITFPKEIASERPTCYHAVDADGKEVVVKFTSKLEAKEEVEFLRRATEHNLWGVVQLIDSQSIETHRQAMSITVMSPFGRPLRHYHSIPEFLEAFRDAIKGHRSLYFDGKLLHRDIHPDNIIITSPETDDTDKENSSGQETDQPRGVLIDLDLAMDLEIELDEADSRVGTLMFMAIDLLHDSKDDWVLHTYRHDLESFFYTFLAMAISVDGKLHESSKLNRWIPGKKCFDDVGDIKWDDMENFRNFYDLVKEFKPEFEPLKPLAYRLRQVLFFPGNKAFNDETKPGIEHAQSLYHDIIQAFDIALEQHVDGMSRAVSALTMDESSYAGSDDEETS